MIRTVADLFERWPAVAPSLGDRGADTIAHTIEMAAPFLRSFGRRRLDTLTVIEVAAWAARFTWNARYARTMLSDAVKLGALEVSPFVGVRVPKGAGRGEHVPSTAEVLALADEGERHGLRVMTLVAYSSGGRVGALAGLQAASVGEGRVSLARKGRPGVYPALLREPGRSALVEVMPHVGRVFSKPGGGAWDRKSVSRCWVLMRRELGLPESCTFHGLRKAFATALIDEGKSWADVAFALDHVDALERPNIDLVQRTYGRPSREAALARLAA